MKWIYQLSDPMGGAAGEAFANTLKSPGMRSEHVLAREAIQNSVDAALEPLDKVLVRFVARRLTGNAKRDFVEAAALEGIAERAPLLGLQSPNCLSHLASARIPLDLLYVEDFGCEGLRGDPHDIGSNFFRLLLSLGDRSKARHSKGSGGSYGFGKSVYSSNSDIQTIFAFTKFFDEDNGEFVSRLFGCGYYPSHQFKKKDYSGRAWLGAPRGRDEEGRVVVDPLEGPKAEALSKALGFSPRSESEPGTSILIVDAPIDLRDIARGIEDFWWPRLVSGGLDAEIVDHTGATSYPRPRARPDLRPFIDSYQIALKAAEPIKGEQKFQRLNNVGQVPLGNCGFSVVKLNENGVPAVEERRCNSVALIRSPQMVVSYHTVSTSQPLVVGAFVASDEVDEALKKSEPPAHDKWDKDSQNLRDKDGKAREFVTAVLSRVSAHLRQFQRETAPPPLSKQKRLSLVERELSSYFRGTGFGPPPPPPGVDGAPLHLDYAQQPHATAAVDGRLQIKAAFSVRLADKAGEDAVRLRLSVSCPILEDENREGDELQVELVSDARQLEASQDESNVWFFSLKKGEKPKFLATTQPYESTWSVRFRPELDRMEQV